MGRFSSGCLNRISLIILLTITENNSQPNEKSDISANIVAKEKYGELLDILADVYEKKFNVLKSYNTLDQYGVGNRILRYFDDSKEPLVAFLQSYKDNPEAIVDALFNIRYRKDHDWYWNSALWHTSQKSTEYFNDDFENGSKMNKLQLYEHRGGEEKKKKLRKIEKEIEKYRGESKHYNSLLRSSCWSKATKRCKKACKAALKTVCEEYKCIRDMKKLFKKSCKSECKDVMDY